MSKVRVLPFIPETLPTARQRYDEAIKPLYAVERIRQLNLEHPGALRKHVFDFKTGIRLVITREHAPLDDDPDLRDPIIHVGAKVMEGKEQLNGSQIPMGEVVRAFLYISRSPSEIKPVHTHISQAGILHILFPSPIKGEYAEETPIEWIRRHEKHRELGTYGEEKTIDPRAFDPRSHCSICSKEYERREQNEG